MTPDRIQPTHRTTDQLVLDLIAQGNSNADGVERLITAVDRQTTARQWNNVAALILVAILALVALDNRMAVSALQAKMCPLVLLLGPGVSSAPPSTERGRDMAVAARDLAEDWECHTR